MTLKKKLLFLLSLVGLVVFFAIIYKIYVPRINAFGCFDDCFNFLGGYFLNSGKSIYSDFFYNHQPGMAYLSAFTQSVFHPSSIPELILRHRQVIFLISSILTFCLFVRFRYPILIASILYEPFKFYVFGDRFLAESIVGYLLIYMVGICLYAFQGNYKKYDSFIMPIVAFLIIFLREPFIPAAVFLLTTYLFLAAKIEKKFPLLPILVFLAPFTFFLTYNFSYYYLNVVTINKLVVASDTAYLPNLLISFFYPVVLIATPGGYGVLRILFVLCSISFLVGFILFTKINKQIGTTVFTILALFLVNLRPVGANQSFYEAFHIAPWLLVFVFFIGFFVIEITKRYIRTGTICIIFICLGVIFLLSNKTHFMYEKVDTSTEYFTNFSHVMDVGTTVRNLSDKDDTFFVDGYDDLIIWEAGLKSPYKYTWYTSYMPRVKLYEDARNKMIEMKIPDFYYGKCIPTLSKESSKSSQSLVENYIQISPSKDKSCILINKEKAKSITEDKKAKLVGTKYSF